MELVDRYLEAVKRSLPSSLQADVTAELSDGIQTQIEEREAALGRPLSVDETGTILKGIGHPFMVASRYRPHQQLIGPALFPFYVNTLKVVLSVALGVVATVGLMVWTTTGDALSSAARVWGAAWATFFTVVGVVTIIFAAVERFQPRGDYAQTWDPRSLPPVQAKGVPRSTSAFELIFNVLFIWIVVRLPDVIHFAATAVLGSNATLEIPFVVGPWWLLCRYALLVATGGHALLNIVNLVRPDWSRLRASTMAVTHAVLFTVVGYIIVTQRNFITLASSVRHPEQYANAAGALNGTVLITLLCFAFISAIMVVINARTMLQRPDSLTSLS